MRITGFVISTPDVAAAQDAWRRLGASGSEISFEVGESGLAAVVLGVDDVPGTERLLERRGLVRDAKGFDVGGLEWRLAPFVPGSTGEVVLDHVVVQTGDAERAAAHYGARLGLELRLDRRLEEHGFRGLFFRCGDAVVEVVAPTKGVDGPDRFGGLAWRTTDLDATRERLMASGVEVSEARAGRKPGTRVATIRDRALGTPTLLIEHGT
ncbi:MAG: glyoxalase/bleomycin resistance/dioxygenase family protein [Kytococcus sp.]|uniref:VOC family protein n=1 Tax=Janibacter terrae TaxID=103817 RepID=UPI0031F8E272|nr:glyoxalase/bleomycin resistance/dioxygenase family protein [Kytococcus sp.]